MVPEQAMLEAAASFLVLREGMRHVVQAAAAERVRQQSQLSATKSGRAAIFCSLIAAMAALDFQWYLRNIALVEGNPKP